MIIEQIKNKESLKESIDNIIEKVIKRVYNIPGSKYLKLIALGDCYI